MIAHEARCFGNPNRLCPVCSRQWPMAELAPLIAALAAIDEKSEPALIAAISEAVEGCPACICSTIVQGPLPMVTYSAVAWDGTETDFEHRYSVTWSYKTARDSYRAESLSDARDFT